MSVASPDKHDLYDPLALDLGRLTETFYETHVKPSPQWNSLDPSPIQAYIRDPITVTKTDLLNYLAQCMLNPKWTIPVIRLFRPIAIDLVARLATPSITDFLDAARAPSINGTVYRNEVVAKAFSTILPILPQAKSLAVLYFTNSISLLERLDLRHSTMTVTEEESAALQNLLLTVYRLLRCSFSSFAPLWDWGRLISLLSLPDVRVKYYAGLCLGLVYQLSDAQTHALLSSFATESPLLAMVDGNQVDLQMLSLYEEQQLAEEELKMAYNTFQPSVTPCLSESDLSPLTSHLCGVLIPKASVSPSLVDDRPHDRSNLVITPTTKRNIHAISLALSVGAPTLLEGVTGSGKTSLVEELAYQSGRGNQLIKIHLGDQTDPKVLLGTYVATSTPGSFRWQAGVLTTAVQEGRWVLIEDIDLAPPEVISVLVPLLESRQLFIPSRGEKITADNNFQLFGTRSLLPRRSGRGGQDGHPLIAGANLWTRVHVDELPLDELETVIRHRFKHMGPFTPHAMHLFRTVTSLCNDPNMTSLAASMMGRTVSTRDFIKWCRRIDRLLANRIDDRTSIAEYDEMTRLDIFGEANDCFAAVIADYATWHIVLERMGEPLQISLDMVRHYVEQYKPSLEQTSSVVRIGRVNLSSMAQQGRLQSAKRVIRRPFATTHHALRLLEKISVCVHLNEPVLLVGETGTGKTTVVQQLADMVHQNLVVVNLSQQSDSSDLLGGFKPVDGKVLAIPLRDEFERLFEKTFSMRKNEKFMAMVRKTFVHQKWTHFAVLLKESVKMAQKKFESEQSDTTKRPTSPQLRRAWAAFTKSLEDFEVQHTQATNKFVFSFIEGTLVKAVRRGDWILLDEINLATTETLECLSGLLQDAHGSLLLTEKGDIEPIQRHPNFRVFACMNPATDVGKRDLPPGLRNRFTEFYVHPPDARQEDLRQIVQQYLAGVATQDERVFDDTVEFYMEAKRLAEQHLLVDGANQRPHFSMRTLSRALTYCTQLCPTYGLRRSLFEGISMTFQTQLDKDSEAQMTQLIHRTILRNVKNPRHLISQIPRRPADHFVQFGAFWLEQGPLEPEDDPQYILTPSVDTKLYNLARVIVSGKFPVLIQGPTSAGKTSMIEYLAKKTGHRFVRINNHEHTDLQEYLGTYISNPDGHLVFQEGVLVEALRHGYWIVLDELNLAPSDVLEALNRLLDDNRELLIPETQEVVRPHPHFMLFATQNPAGLYGGRKALSRAFRNRFLELHFNDIPEEELETILSRRCRIAPSYCKKLVEVYKTLMSRRQGSRLFEQKHGFITLRDLFRWAGRDPNGYQELAEQGYMLLAERCRREEEKLVVKQALETVMKVKIDEDSLYNCEGLEEFTVYDRLLQERQAQSGNGTRLVWTRAMRRLFTLVARCLQHNEPVLLVGDTGCGKTTVCQMLAETYSRELHIVNCHQNTETSDLLGGQRPVRHRENEQQALFEWHDGPLVQAMRQGHLFLLDEISLADDSVLERLNSVLEPSRLLVLAEKGSKQVEELYGADGFQFLATMNPGGDYGKKELSPALRNRFTEIWVPAFTDRHDLLLIIREQLERADLAPLGDRMLDFIEWYTQALSQTRAVISLRDLLAWVTFINVLVRQGSDPNLAFVHGGCLVILDSLGTHASVGSALLAGDALKTFRLKCLRHLSGNDQGDEQAILGQRHIDVQMDGSQLDIGGFRIPRGPLGKVDVKFSLLAPTTADNATRVARAMQLKKPILLEGSPGVGKTSLITALAAASGHHLVRINLSQQTDLMDLFGSDLPVEGGASGEFAWRDAPFLQAMKAGDWVLLDELNLASQSVLEGLNSCLDHRAVVYIPELDREFTCEPSFRVFGAQNPLQQGGGRKGLPKSFVNRFTQVFVEQLTADDLNFICAHLFPTIDRGILQQMIRFNTEMYEATMVHCRFGRKGSPWEFNLRDVFRWLELMERGHAMDPAEYVDIIYMKRMRTVEDREHVRGLFEKVFERPYCRPEHPAFDITPGHVVIGNAKLPRRDDGHVLMSSQPLHLVPSLLAPMEALMTCVQSDWMAIVTGPSGSCKTSLVRLLSQLTGNPLAEFAMNSSVDTMELLGGFEQVDLNRHRQVVMDRLEYLTRHLSRRLVVHQLHDQAQLSHVEHIYRAWHTIKQRHGLQRLSNEAEGALDYTLLSDLVSRLSAVAVGVEQDQVASLTSQVRVLQQLEQGATVGKFEWIDGLLIHALEQGHWLLIDNANLCDPSVLDRLNSLFEKDGMLMVNERGLVDGTVKVIRPHPDFRMFMTVDPMQGELSRAMRNRGLEIALTDIAWHRHNTDALRLANGLGLRGGHLPIWVRELQDPKSRHVREYIHMLTYMVERLQRGQPLKEAICDAFTQVHVNTDLPPLLTASDASVDSLLEPVVSPANYPILVGGPLFIQNAALATVAIQGAYLLALLQTTCDSQSQMDTASDYFIHGVSGTDYHLRTAWLAFVLQNCLAPGQENAVDRVAQSLTMLSTHPLYTEWIQRKSSMDLQQSLVAPDNVLEALRLVLRIARHMGAVNRASRSSQRVHTSRLTLFQQSYAVAQGRITVSELMHPVVSHLYPLLETLGADCIDLTHHALELPCQLFVDLHTIWDLVEYWWPKLMSSYLSVDNVVILVRILKERMEAIDQNLLTRTRTMVDMILSSVDLDTCTSMKTLWRHFSPVTLSTQALHDLEMQLFNVNSILDWSHHRHGDQLQALFKSIKVPVQTKQTLVEGMATLYAIQDRSEQQEVASILASLAHLPEQLARELEAVKEDSSLHKWDTALVPLADYQSLVDEMGIVARLYAAACGVWDPSTAERLQHQLKVFCQWCLQQTTRPPADLLHYQTLLWALEANDLYTVRVSVAQDAAHTWHRRLWRSSVHQRNLYQLTSSSKDEERVIPSDGSSCLHENVTTMSCLLLLNSIETVPIEKFDTVRRQLKQLRNVLYRETSPDNRVALELVMLLSTAYQILVAISNVLPDNAGHELRTHLADWPSFISQLANSHAFAVPATLCEQWTGMALLIAQLERASVHQVLLQAMYTLQQAIQAAPLDDLAQFYTLAGKSRIYLGMTFVAFYVPDYPADPTAEPRLRMSLLVTKKDALTEALQVDKEVEAIFTGNLTNAVMETRQRHIMAIEHQLDQSITTFALRPEASQLEEIFTDLHYLQKSFIRDSIEPLLRDMASGDTASLVQREELLQGTVREFIDRVCTKYPLYRDILQPLLVAVEDIKYGLRIMTKPYHQDHNDAFLSSIVGLLLSDPDVVSYASFNWHELSQHQLHHLKTIVLERAPAHRKWAWYLRIVLVVLEHVVMQVDRQGYLDQQGMESINTLFGEIVQTWKAAEAYKRQKQEEKEQLYKTRAKKYGPEVNEEEEAELEERRALFADFEEEYADLRQDDDDETPMRKPDEVQEESVLDEADVRRVGRLHRTLFDTYHTQRCHRTDSSWDPELLKSYTAAGTLMRLTTSPFNDRLDLVSWTEHVHMTNTITQQLEQETVGDTYDFYQSSNVAEVKLIEPVLVRFKNRVMALLEDWPEQVSLQQLVVICDRLLGFPVTSPIAKLMTGIELLLQRSEDWEAYAAKHVSIQAERDEVTKLIIRWRQLELRGWVKLLDAQEQYLREAAFDWWFDLYSAVNQAFVDDAHDVLGALDHFMQVASVAEFEPRIGMIHSFSRQMYLRAELCEDPEEKANHHGIAAILRNVYQYYAQFRENVCTMLSQLRKPIEKDLKDFVKLASWKDVNIFALRQSAQKTHRHLHKCVRKYKEVLGTSMLTVIANYNQETPMFQYGDEKRYTETVGMALLASPATWLAATKVPTDLRPSMQPIKAHLTDLGLTLQRLRRYCERDVFKVDSVLPLEVFITSVIEQIKTFQKETPAVMTDENKSMVKNQKLLKKKALVDFLKELKRLGLKWRAPALMEQNANLGRLFTLDLAPLDWMLEADSLPGIAQSAWHDMEKVWHKANDYYARTTARISHLRTVSSTQVNKDLSRLEVERSMNVVEHLFALVVEERLLLAQVEQRMRWLHGVSVQLSAMYAAHQGGQAAADHDTLAHLAQHKKHLDTLTALLNKAKNVVPETSTTRDHVHNMFYHVRTMQAKVDKVYSDSVLYPQSAMASNSLVVSDSVLAVIDSDRSSLSDMLSTLRTKLEAEPMLVSALYPIIVYGDRMASQQDAVIDTNDADKQDLSGLVDAGHAVIDAVLVATQDMRSLQLPQLLPDEEMGDGYIKEQHQAQRTTKQALHLEAMIKRSQHMLDMACALTLRTPSSEVANMFAQVHPFFEQYMLVVQHTLGKMLLHHKSMTKLTFGMISSLNIIFSKGFCMPQGAEEEEEEDTGGMAAGTGIGEGEGAKDVSNEIEDEDQVMGTQNEEKSQSENPTEEEENGLDMSQDFEGNLEDVQREPDEDQDQSDEEDEEGEEDVDEGVGDVDDLDPDAVDEKMWGDDADETNNDTDKTVDETQPQGERNAAPDVVAKEDGKEETSNDSKDKSDEPADQEMNEFTEDQDAMDEEEQGQEEDTGDHMPDNQPVDVPEAETLDLPDDLNLDGGEDEEEGKEEEEPWADAMDQDDLPEPSKDTDHDVEEDNDDTPMEDALDAFNEVENDDEKMEEEEPVKEEDDEGAVADQQGQGEDAKEEEEEEEVATGDLKSNPPETSAVEEIKGEEEQDADKKAQNSEQPQSDTTAENTLGVQGEAGKASMSTLGQEQGEDEQQGGAEQEEKEEAPKEQQGSAGHGGAAGAQDEKESEDKTRNINPQRSLGDALEHWRRRLADVTDPTEEETQDQSEQKPMDQDQEQQVREDQAFEYIQHDDEAYDMQTAGDAAADQLQDLHLGAMDDSAVDETQYQGQVEETAMDVDTMPLPPATLDAQRQDVPGAIMTRQVKSEMDLLTVDASVVSHAPLEQQDVDLLRTELETQVSSWREQGRDTEEALQLWQRYEQLTQDLAMGLCEQLRLILEPTLATKLKGDYRTGKRLNMKKIIPYIASQFKKDKIWLRRTKPSKRQYQVMIAVDDSKSMSESHAVQLAYETLSLTSKALSHLEAGDISIVSFGERVRLLHPFDQPFTSQAGASVLQQFTFAQTKTHVKNLIETTLHLFEQARHGGQQNLWQLQLVISDGVCEDHETITALVRRALEQRIMIIFIIVDDKPDKDSILNMTSVRYTTTEGKLSLQMQPYLDTFPFEYFMVLRDINALPETLSDALRQYFSLVSTS